MIKPYSIIQSLIRVTCVASILLFTACGNTQNSEPDDTKEVAEDQNDAKFDNNSQEKDAQFLVNAAEMSLEEIQLGQLAQKNGTASHVKALGKMMEEGHTKSLNDLTALAKAKMITIPTSATNDAQDTYKNLSEKSGKAFDKAYSDKMVSGHKDAIDSFEKASEDCKDNDIKNWAKGSLPALRTHLDHSIQCQKDCEKS